MQHLSHAVTVISKRLFLVTVFVIQFLRNRKHIRGILNRN